jgi:hypothetical protein
MNTTQIKQMITAGLNSEYNETNKRTFHRLAIDLLKEVAELANVGEHDLRWSEGGIAVSGDAVLHAERVYVKISGAGLGILVRACQGRNDFRGLENTWFSWHFLVTKGAQGLADRVSQIAASQI